MARFVGGMRQKSQHTLNLFRPLSVSEAHQQALTIEAQLKSNYPVWNSSRQARSSLPSRPTNQPLGLLVPRPEQIVTIPDNTRITRPGTLRCFNCGEQIHRQSACPKRNNLGLLLDDTGQDVEVIYDKEDIDKTEELTAYVGHLLVVRRTCLAPKVLDAPSQRNTLFQYRCTINGRICNLIIDSGSCENVIAKVVVSKLNLHVQPHPTPYKLGWIQQGSNMSISTRALVDFSIGNAYKDQLLCDIALMDACHLC